MMPLDNIDLFYALVGGATTIFLGILVLLHNRRGAANIIFIIHAVTGSIWAMATYFSVVAPPADALLWIRLVIFFAVPHVFLFFLFVQNFPENLFVRKKIAFWGTLACMGMLMGLSLTPMVFSEITIVGNQIIPVPGPLIALFATILLAFFLLTVVQVFRKFFEKDRALRKQWIAIGTGFLTAYFLLIFFVFVRVVFFDNPAFVPYSPLFIVPIFIGAAFAILREHLFSVKVVAAEIMTFFLLFAGFIDILSAQSISSVVIGVFVILFTIIFGMLLIQSVLREVKQREELEKLNRELDVANKQLEDLSRFKSQLLSLASHQIRSPLAAMKGFISLIQAGAYGEINEKVKETLGKVQYSADDLIGLINTLLDVRKVEEGKMEYAFATEDIVPLVKGIVDGIQPLAMAKKLELTADLPSAPVMASIDHEKFKQVVQNLIDNAIKYTPSGFVKASLTVDSGKISISVSDSGLGIPADLVPHLFEEFIRDERVKKEIRGTGLGLFIARKITEAHGGTLTAASPGEGKGSTFTAIIPVAS